MEHHRPNGQLAQGYFCNNCGQSCNMYATGHVDMRNPRSGHLCTPNKKLVKLLEKANRMHPVFTIPAVIREEE